MPFGRRSTHYPEWFLMIFVTGPRGRWASLRSTAPYQGHSQSAYRTRPVRGKGGSSPVRLTSIRRWKRCEEPIHGKSEQKWRFRFPTPFPCTDGDSLSRGERV